MTAANEKLLTIPRPAASGREWDPVLAPVPGGAPCGRDIRHEGDYERIAEARLGEDPRFSQGVWKRDLKRANWHEVKRLCEATLSQRSKDLWPAVWLTEALVHLRGVAGAASGLRLLAALCEDFWPGLFPALEPDDASARLAPAEWLDEHLPAALRGMPLFRSKSDPDTFFSWADYVNAQRLEGVRARDPKAAERAEAAGATALARVRECCRQTDTAQLNQMESELRAAEAARQVLRDALVAHCAKEAPGLGGIRAALDDILATIAVELGERRKSSGAAQLLRGKPPQPTAIPSPAPPPTAPVRLLATRDDAYAQLADVAELLLRIEPHSPTPYLIRRAIEWGQLSFPELIAHLSRGGHDISAVIELLGLDLEDLDRAEYQSAPASE